MVFISVVIFSLLARSEASSKILGPIPVGSTTDEFPESNASTTINWIPYNGYQYYLNQEPANWLYALYWCTTHNSRLASILSLEENVVINDIVESKLGRWCRKPNHPQKSKFVWIGGLFNETREQFVWSDGEQWTFPNTIIGPSTDLKNMKEGACLKYKSKFNCEKHDNQLDVVPESLIAVLEESRSVNPWIVAPCSEKHAFICKKKIGH